MTDQAVTREILLDQVLPAPLPTGHVEVRRISMGADTAAGPHTHNGPVFGSIERGSVVFRIEDGPEVTLRAGDTFYEPADTVITRFDATDEGVVFLGYFLMPEGESATLTLVD